MEHAHVGVGMDYANILNSITEGIYAIDRHGNCIYCNSSCLRILKYQSAADLLGKNMHELIHYAHADGKHYSGRACTIYKSAAQGLERFSDSEVFWTADGDAIPVAYYSYPQFDNGVLTGAVITFSDISQEKNQLKKLEASEARYRNIFRNANSGIIYVDESGYTISANQAFQDLVQYSISELQLMNFQQLVYPEDLERELIFRREMADGARDEYTMEKRYIRKDGKLVWANICVSKFQEGFSSPIYFVGIVHDINDKKEYEQQLLESNAAKDKFFSIIAHDLRNPVGALKMLSEFMQDALDNNDFSEVKELSGMLNEQVNHTYNLLNDLLEWSRAQTRQISFNPKHLNLAQVIAERAAANKILALTKHITLDYAIEENLMVTADADMLETVLRNLITNAIKFSFEKSCITLTAREKNSEIVITVEDHGKGIPDKLLKKLFLPDVRTSRPGTHNESGTGLGLLLCKEFIELHGGSIWAESEVGVGSRFHFTLPKSL